MTLPTPKMVQAGPVVTDVKNMNHIPTPPLNGLFPYKNDIRSYLVV